MATTKSLGTVGTVDVAITTVGVCDMVQVFEDAQAATTDFKFRGNGSTDYVTYPAGKQLELFSGGRKPFEAGATIGYIKRVDADATFVQLETP
jgi:hypothetical protein